MADCRLRMTRGCSFQSAIGDRRSAIPIMDEPRMKFDSGNGHSSDEPPSEAFRDAMAQIGEAKEYLSHFVAAKVDGIKVAARSAAVWAALGVLGLLTGGAILVTAAVLLVIGMAQGVSALLKGHTWAGNLIVGFVLLALAGVGAWFGMKRLFDSSRKRTVDRYERRLQRQRVEFGHDARERSAERAAAAASKKAGGTD
jgi:hypothetical protein